MHVHFYWNLYFFSIFLSQGLLQREYPGIAISVKTRQSIRSVLNTAMDTVYNLRGGGLLDETEAKKLEKVGRQTI